MFFSLYTFSFYVFNRALVRLSVMAPVTGVCSLSQAVKRQTRQRICRRTKINETAAVSRRLRRHRRWVYMSPCS